MATNNIYVRGNQTTRGDLDLYTVDNANQPVNVAEISYALYDASTGVEVLLGSSARSPINPTVGEYYAAFYIPPNANPGLYRLRWRFRETLSSPENVVLEEFYVVEARENNPLELYSDTTLFMLRRLRISLRDQNPDRNYRFRPPTHEGTINQFTRVFGYIWEDHELVEFLSRGVDYVNLVPPSTGFNGVDAMVLARSAWREMIIYAAMANALMALSINWVAEEFSLRGDQLIEVQLEDGTFEKVTMLQLWEAVYG
jgi:hypothetical protein